MPKTRIVQLQVKITLPDVPDMSEKEMVGAMERGLKNFVSSLLEDALPGTHPFKRFKRGWAHVGTEEYAEQLEFTSMRKQVLRQVAVEKVHA